MLCMNGVRNGARHTLWTLVKVYVLFLDAFLFSLEAPIDLHGVDGFQVDLWRMHSTSVFIILTMRCQSL